MSNFTSSLLLWTGAIALALLAYSAQSEAPGTLASIGFLLGAIFLLPPARRAISKYFTLTKWRTTALVSITTFVGLATVTNHLDEKAKALGFKSASEMKRANKLGLESPQALTDHDSRQERQRKAAEQHTIAVQAREESKCRSDLQCWGDKHSISASVACSPYIERLAQYQHEWTGGWLEMKFGRFRWKDQSSGHITFIGDSIKFQNGFGAWQYHIYTCDFDPTTKSVLDVAATPGRLPK